MTRAAPPTTSDPTLFSRKVRVLLLAANPSDTARLAVGEECRKIREALQAAEGGGRFDLTIEHEPRAEEFAQALQRHRPDVVHFSGHGSEAGEIFLPDATGQATPARHSDIAELFAILSRDLRIRCVVLNACYSEPLAEALSPHVDCVIGISVALQDSAAVAFASSFYESLGFGRDVDAAYRLACNRVALTVPTRPPMPRLHHLPSVDPTQVRLVRSTTPPAPPETIHASPSQTPPPPQSVPAQSSIAPLLGGLAVAVLVASVTAFALHAWLDTPTTAAPRPQTAAPTVAPMPAQTPGRASPERVTRDPPPASAASSPRGDGHRHGHLPVAPRAQALTPAPPPVGPPASPTAECAVGDPDCDPHRR